MDENFFGLTDTGKFRDSNEDAFLAHKPMDGQVILAAVIDGVGGYSGGEVAAKLTHDTVSDYFKVNSADANQLPRLRESLVLSNTAIALERQLHDEHRQMACVATLVLVDIEQNKLYYAHVGDTRLYLLRDGGLVKLSHDHSFVGFLEDSGRLTEKEAMNHAKRNEIDKALGFDGILPNEEYIETGESPFLPGDHILLCSDGLTDLVNKKAMETILFSNDSLETKAHKLIAAANNAGGKDNITVVLVANNKQSTPLKAVKPLHKSGKEVVAETPVIATEFKSEKPPKLIPKDKGSGAIPLLLTLVILLVVACAWLVYQQLQNKDRRGIFFDGSATTVAISKTETETRLLDQIDHAKRNEVFVINTSGQLPYIITDTIKLTADTLHIIGNGAVLTSGENFAGPAFFIAPSVKHLVLDSLTFTNFSTAIVVGGGQLQLQNITFTNCALPVQYNFGWFNNKTVTDTMGTKSVSVLAPLTTP